MNVTLTSLEALILKATHESLPCPDAAALEAFCAVMRDSAEGPQLAAQALAARIHTPNSREAMLALSMIDRCMRRCDATFHAEVGKFRFLNEMIKLVSPKYLADRTAPEVRTRVLQSLHAWSIEYPKESKFKVAYDMLKNQGVVKETPPPLPPEDEAPPSRIRAKNAIFEDEDKSKLLQKLLQSKKPEDIQHANRLIKTMVREEERRNEANCRRAQEVGAALDSAGLLRDMLQCAENASPDEEQLIQELHSICARMRPVLQQLAASDAHADNLSDILQAIDLLDDVHIKYNAFTSKNNLKQPPASGPHPSNSGSLLDFAGANIDKGHGEPKIVAKKNSFDELGDLFTTGGEDDVGELLQPVNLMPSEDVDLLGEKPKVEGWNELDSLGEQLLKQSLPENAKRGDSFNSRSKKIPMNALTTPKREPPLNNGAIFDLDYFIKKPEDEPKLTNQHEDKPANQSPSSPIDDVMVDITDAPITSTINNATDSILDLGLPVDSNAKCDATPIDNREKINSEEPVNNAVHKSTEGTNSVAHKSKSEVKPLTDINVTLQSVQPSKVPPLTAFEEEGGVTVVLHFCKDKPRPDVNVIVVSTTSRNSSPIEDYKFQGVVPKGCKVRLLPPSGSSLPAYNPFLPPPALTQVMVVARPPSSPPVDLKFVITYTCDDDACSEMGEVRQLPLDDV